METAKQLRDPISNDQSPSALDWQMRVERLQEALCLLLLKNQVMRMALSAGRAGEQLYDFLPELE